MNAKRVGSTFAILLLVGWTSLASAAPPPAASSGGELAGRIDARDATPVGGARVLAYHLSSERVFTSEATRADGEYRLTGLPDGYFDLAVDTGEDLFVADRVVHLSSAGKAVLNMTVRPPAAAETGGASPRIFPGADRPTTGVVSVWQKPNGREFWSSPSGVSLIAGGGLLGLLAAASNDRPASPSAPN